MRLTLNQNSKTVVEAALSEIDVIKNATNGGSSEDNIAKKKKDAKPERGLKARETWPA